MKLNSLALKRLSRIAGVGLIITATVAFTGCGGSSGRSKSDTTATTLKDTDQGMGAAAKQIEATLGSLNALASVKEGDLREPYKAFHKDVDKSMSLVKKAQEQAGKFQAATTAYFAKWDAELATMTNPEIKAASQKRRDSLQNHYNSIVGHVDDLKAASEPFLNNLGELVKFLDLDLTQAGLKTIAPVITKSNESGQALMTKLNQITYGVQKMLGEIAPSMPMNEGAPAGGSTTPSTGTGTAK